MLLSTKALVMTFKEIVHHIKPIPDSSFDKLSQLTTEQICRRGEFLFREGKVNNNIYFIGQGLARAFVFHEHHEVTFWFAREADPLLSIQSYVNDLPGYENIELLEDCVLFQLKKQDLERLYHEDIHLANWGRRLADQSFVDTEKRLISRQFKSSMERYEDLIKKQPDLFRRVPLKLVASYLGMTQVTLSRIRAKR